MKRITIVLTILLTATLASGDGPARISWGWGPVLPTAQSALATTAVGDDIVVVGGTYWVGPRDGVPHKVWLRTVEKLDTQAMQWESLPRYPLPVGYALAVADGSKLWVIGGRNADRVHAEVYTLDLARENPSWIPAPSLPLPRAGARGGISAGVIYIAAGTEEYHGQPRPASSVLALDTNDLERGWQVVGEVPRPELEWPVGTVCGGKLYLFGGLVADEQFTMAKTFIRSWHNVASSIPVRDAYCFDIATRKWQQIRPLPLACGTGACTALDDSHVIIAGGVALAIPASRISGRKLHTYFSTQCLLYDTVRDRYHPLNPMPVGVGDQGCAYVNERLYMIGGEDSPWKTRTDLVQVGRVH